MLDSRIDQRKLLANLGSEWKRSADRILRKLAVCPQLWITTREHRDLIMPLEPKHFPRGQHRTTAQAIEDTLCEHEAATFEAIGKAALDNGATRDFLLLLVGPVSPYDADILCRITPEAYVKDANRLWHVATRYNLAYLFIEAEANTSGPGNTSA